MHLSKAWEGFHPAYFARFFYWKDDVFDDIFKQKVQMYAYAYEDNHDQDVTPCVLALAVWVQVREKEADVDDEHRENLIHKLKFCFERLLLRQVFG